MPMGFTSIPARSYHMDLSPTGHMSIFHHHIKRLPLDPTLIYLRDLTSSIAYLPVAYRYSINILSFHPQFLHSYIRDLIISIAHLPVTPWYFIIYSSAHLLVSHWYNITNQLAMYWGIHQLHVPNMSPNSPLTGLVINLPPRLSLKPAFYHRLLLSKAPDLTPWLVSDTTDYTPPQLARISVMI